MNPYKVLKIETHATMREIIQAVALAMRERNFSARDIAMAQKELMNPVTRRVHEFLHFIDVAPLVVRPSLPPQKKESVSDLARLSLFD